MPMEPESHAQLEDLIAQYGRLIRTIVRKVTRSRTDLLAEDVEQRVVLGLWRQLDREQTIHRPASYIYRMAVREAVRAVREQMRYEIHETSQVADEPDSAPGPDRGLEAREQAAVIERCLRELQPDRERAVRAHLAGFSVAEIMDLHGWPYQTARNLVARGLADLRAALRRHGLHE
jgi:RNA polymerase sigma-70 factor (ECF subfamily)